MRIFISLLPLLAFPAQPGGDSVSISGVVYDVISSADDRRMMVTVVRGRTQYLCIIPGTEKAATAVWNALDIDQPIAFEGTPLTIAERQRLLGHYFRVPHEWKSRNVVLHPCRITRMKAAATTAPPK